MVTESEFQEAVDLAKAANLVKVKNVLERFFQENVELRAKLAEKGEDNAKSSRTSKN